MNPPGLAVAIRTCPKTSQWASRFACIAPLTCYDTPPASNPWSMRMGTPYAYVRVRKMSFSNIGDAARHARGDDAEHRRRDDAGEARAVVAWHGEGDGEWRTDVAKRHEDHPANDYLALFKEHKKRHKAQEYGNYDPIRHLIVGVSSDAIGGDGHDPNDRRLRELLRAAVDWANEEFGGVFAARADVDERGQGEIDVLVAPVRDVQCGRAKAKKAKIVPGRALEEFARRKGGTARSYSLMPDSWAAFARGRGFDVARGRRKKETGKEHLSPEDYGEAKDAARSQAEHNRQQLAAIEEAERRLAAERRQIEEDRARLRTDLEDLSRREDELERKEVALAAAETANAEEARKLAAERVDFDRMVARFRKKRDEARARNRAERQRIEATLNILRRGLGDERLMHAFMDIAFSRLTGANEEAGRKMAADCGIDYDTGRHWSHGRATRREGSASNRPRCAGRWPAHRGPPRQEGTQAR